MITTRQMVRALMVVTLASLAATGLDAQPAPPRATLTEDLRIDAFTEDFSAVSRIYVGPAGQMVVPFRQEMQLRLYDATGRRVASFGRRGSGPGEFQSMGSLKWKLDTLVVFDVRQRRLTYIAPSGAFARVTGLPAALNRDPFSSAATTDTSFMFFTPATVLPDGSMIGTAHMRIRGAGDGDVPHVIVHYTDARGPRVVGRPPNMLDDRWQMTIAGLSNPVPFAFQPTVSIANDGRRAFLSSVITNSRGGEYTLSYFAPNGDTLFTKTTPFEGERIPQRAIDSAIAVLGRPNGELPGAGPRFQALARERVRPVRHSVADVLVGHDNTVWVDLRPTGSSRTTLVSMHAARSSRLCSFPCARAYRRQARNAFGPSSSTTTGSRAWCGIRCVV